MYTVLPKTSDCVSTFLLYRFACHTHEQNFVKKKVSNSKQITVSIRGWPCENFPHI